MYRAFLLPRSVRKTGRRVDLFFQGSSSDGPVTVAVAVAVTMAAARQRSEVEVGASKYLILQLKTANQTL